jgi:hypothetical protein
MEVLRGLPLVKGLGHYRMPGFDAAAKFTRAVVKPSAVRAFHGRQRSDFTRGRAV